MFDAQTYSYLDLIQIAVVKNECLFLAGPYKKKAEMINPTISAYLN